MTAIELYYSMLPDTNSPYCAEEQEEFEQFIPAEVIDEAEREYYDNLYCADSSFTSDDF